MAWLETEPPHFKTLKIFLMSKNKDKEIGTDAQAGAIASTETAHPNPARAASDTAEVATTEPSTKAADTKTAEEPKVSDTLVKIGKSILKGNPAMSVVYMASDGRGFYEKNDADNHARTLKNKAVTPVKK